MHQVQPFYPATTRTLRPAWLIGAHTPPSVGYDEAADALPLDATDIEDISIGVGDTVRYFFPSYGSFDGTVTAYDEASDRYAVERCDEWGVRTVPCGRERLQLLVKAGALEAEDAAASAR